MRTKKQQLRNYINRNGGTILLIAYYLFIIQFQCKFNSGGTLVKVKSRYNPYNPLTYLLLTVAFITSTFVVIYEGVIKDFTSIFPTLFKYN